MRASYACLLAAVVALSSCGTLSEAPAPSLCRSPALAPGKLEIGGEPFTGQIAAAEAGLDEAASPQVQLRFNADGAAAFARITTTHVGEEISIMVDDVVVLSPHVAEPVTGGTVVISGRFTAEEALELARRLAPACPPPA